MSPVDKARLEKLYVSEKPDYANAIAIQKELSNRVGAQNGFSEIKTVAGADLAILKDQSKLVCGIIVFSYPDLREIERAWEVVDDEFPYIPGLLAFREGPAIIRTYEKLKNKPDLLILDGHGTAHPRAFGIACYVGVLLDIPAMGIAKKKLYGEYNEPKGSAGSHESLLSKDSSQIGVALRTKERTKPVFISIGHKIDLSTSVKIALSCTRGYRVPEPTRLADKYVSELKRGFK